MVNDTFGGAMLGLETEFGFAAFDCQGRRADGTAQEAIFKSIREQLACLPGGNGVFLQNGGLVYIDCSHLEWATPETTSPAELVTYVRAGDLLLAEIVEQLERELGFSQVRIFKSNVDYLENTTWGCHESYLYRHNADRLPEQLIPHLVSRIVYTGNGGLNCQSDGIEFSLSPRVGFIHQRVSSGSTTDRGIFHTKDESLASPGYHRLHVLCGDSNCSEWQTWLKTGTTMLIVAIIDAGFLPGQGVRLKSPLSAMRAFAADPSCKVKVGLAKGGKELSAIGIQRHYLEIAEMMLGSDFMPPWAKEICRAWRKTLDALASDPACLATTLDWALKQQLFSRCIDKHETVSAESIAVWNDVLAELHGVFKGPASTRSVVNGAFARQHISGTGLLSRELRKLAKRLAAGNLSWDLLDDFRRLRFELCEYDSLFGEIGGRGIFESLDRAGALAHRVVPEADIRRARAHPPAAGRARVRGNSIRQLVEQKAIGYHCSWRGISGPGGVLDLSDPFEANVSWRGRGP